jgi:hypothetical protein
MISRSSSLLFHDNLDFFGSVRAWLFPQALPSVAAQLSRHDPLD